MTNAVITAQQGSSQGGDIGFKNRVINGDMRIDQRNNGVSVTSVIGAAFSCDRHQLYSGVAAGRFTAQQNLNSVAPPSGFKNYLGVSSVAAATLGATESLAIVHHIEGYNIIDFDWGLSTAKAATLSFWVYCNLSGTFGGTIRNSPGNRTYPYTFTIPTANTWTYITVTVPGDTAGTWYNDNRSGIQVWINLGTGTSLQGTANTWAGSDYRAPSGTTNLVAVAGALMYVTGLQFEVGSAATGFDYRSYGTELALCQRYCEYINFVNFAYIGYKGGCIPFAVTKRAAPTVTFWSASNFGGTLGSLVEANASGTAYAVTQYTATVSSMGMVYTSFSGTANFAGSLAAVSEL